MARTQMTLPNLPQCDPEQLRLDKEVLQNHSDANARQIAMGYMPGVAECAVKDNRVIFVDIRGYQDKEMRKPMTDRSLFRCHSMTKPITAVAFMSLWEEGRLALDDPVHKYIPAFKNMKVLKPGGRLEDAKRPITLRHLVMHTSGLGYGPSRERKTEKLEEEAEAGTVDYVDFVKRIDRGHIKNLKSFCEELAELPLQFHPGERWEYSMGLDVLGRVLEVVAQMPLDRLFRRRVFQQMGMKDTAFSVTPHKARRQLTAYYVTKVHSKHRKSKKPNRFVARRCDGIHPQMSAWVRGRSLRVLSGGGICGSFAGGLLSSLRDQTIFCNVLLNRGFAASTGRQVLKPNTVKVICRDWLRLKSSSPKQKLRGWGMGRDVGWCPLGHWMPKHKVMFMGGITTNWSIAFASRTLQVSMTSSSCEADDLHNWDDRKDDLSGALEHAEKVWKRKRARAV